MRLYCAKKLGKLRWFWPIIQRLPPDAQADYDTWMKGIGDSVKEGDWAKDSEVALDEARRIFDAETDRRKSADAKAGIYLAAITALIPVLVSLLPSLWNDKASKVLSVTSLFVFTWAVAYLLRAGGWAFSTLKVAGFTQVGPGEIATCWKKEEPKVALAKSLAMAAFLNFPSANQKVTGIKMTHEYLLRAFLSFTVLMVVQVVWPVGTWIVVQAGGLWKTDPPKVLVMCFS
ncbi:hypothetical protein FQ192_24150 [Pseudomonas sp. ANT_J12]|uniref:hypothetical protein n=1 Tax=Pseudomonas sp. ANT_J12 TaxID=2597351 RepID=UPI0011F3A1D9|nr:hypothetical protein [Pseudomonas sp. ANT_J12]KAA0986243.1 hypothetical protein FQ192_24150 [Pseudomonas sp. ANT_J12]